MEKYQRGDLWDLPDNPIDRKNREEEIADDLSDQFDEMTYEFLNKILEQVKEENDMSSIYMTIENVTEEDESWDTYSVIDNMVIYRVEVEEPDYNVYDQQGNNINDAILEDTLISQVEEFRKGE